MQSVRTYVTAGEVTALKHEFGDDTMELGACIAEALLAGAEGGEVLHRLGDNIIVELEVDTSFLLCKVNVSNWSLLKLCFEWLLLIARRGEVLRAAPPPRGSKTGRKGSTYPLVRSR
jgi:hypothetical protein